MRKLILGMQMSLDGYIAGPGGDMSWVDTGDEAWKHNFESFNSSDTILLGRVLYEGFMQYWPAAGKDPKSGKYERQYSEWIEKAMKYVFSRSLFNAQWGNTVVISGDPLLEVTQLKKEPGKDLLLAGGASLARSFAGLGLVDEYRLLIVPKILGSGTSFLSGITDRLNLRLLSERKLKSGTIAAHYAKV